MVRRKALSLVDPLRLDSIGILRRKFRAQQAMAPDMVGAVFNPAEVRVLERIAAGEVIIGVDLSQERAAKELAWIGRGGQYACES